MTSAQVPPADLDVPILGQLAPAQLPLGEGLEAGLLKEYPSTHRSGVGRSGKRRWNIPREPDYGVVQ